MTHKEKLIVCCYYTSNHDYRSLANTLKDSVEEFGIECHVQEYPHPYETTYRGHKHHSHIAWILGCSICPQFLVDMRMLFPGRNILYLDADALMLESPDLFLQDIDYDIAYAIIKKTTASGTIFLNGDSDLELFLNSWAELQTRRTEVMMKKFNQQYLAWDQITFKHTLKEFPKLTQFILPGEYCKIAPLNGNDFHKIQNEPIIYQQQASRETKGTCYEHRDTRSIT